MTSREIIKMNGFRRYSILKHDKPLKGGKDAPITSEAIALGIEDFLANGGKIEILPSGADSRSNQAQRHLT